MYPPHIISFLLTLIQFFTSHRWANPNPAILIVFSYMTVTKFGKKIITLTLILCEFEILFTIGFPQFSKFGKGSDSLFDGGV